MLLRVLAHDSHFSLFTIGDKVLKDSPTVILHAEFYNEEGFDLWLREDMTVKAKEITLMSTTDKYGTYKVKRDTLFLSSINIKHGFSEVNDTMYFKEDKLVFRLDKEWRNILESYMYIEKNKLK